MKKEKEISFTLILSAVVIAGILFFRTPPGILIIKRISTLNNAIITGNTGWLFYRGDLDYAIFPWMSAAKNLIRIDALAKKNGAKLYMVPIPNKIDLYPGFLDSSIATISFLEKKSARFFAHLKENDVAILDIYDLFRTAKNNRMLYDPDESHVTSYGIRLAVDETVRRFFPSFTDSSTDCLRNKNIAFVGNLSRNKETVPERKIAICYNSCASAGSSGDTILIIGDSYCAYLAEFRGSYPDLLEGRLRGNYVFQTHYKIDAGFRLGKKIAAMLGKKPRHKIIIWLFSAREFYKPLTLY